MKGPPTRTLPRQVEIEGFQVTAFPDAPSLFARVVRLARGPRRAVVAYLNVHVANEARRNERLREFLCQADVLYCDGAGIRLGSWILGDPLPTRLTAADWFVDLLQHLASERLTVYLLGADPGVSERARAVLAERIPEHTIIGTHHGYFLTAAGGEAAVIAEIGRLRPDVLFVGLGTPAQEEWVARHRDVLSAKVLFPIGAVLDFVSGRVPRCPPWMGRCGIEWVYRLWTEPRRLSGRYLLGNPRFLTRMVAQRLRPNA